MVAIYRASLRTTRITDVLTDVDSGAGAGKLKLYASGGATLLASITLADPAGTVSGDVLTFTMPQSDTSADNTGVAAEATITTSADDVVISGLTVGTSATDIILSDTSITQTQVVTIESAAITHASS